MRLALEFRNRALECIKQADAAPTLEIRAYWTGMAQLWHNLATHLEQTHLTSEGCSVLAPLRGPLPAEGRH
jgi:hypothetical protein